MTNVVKVSINHHQIHAERAVTSKGGKRMDSQVNKMQKPTPELLDWLLAGDPSIRYQVYRDLMETHRLDLQSRISQDGWGKIILDQQHPSGHWGDRFYQPKWTSTHYTLLDLKNLNLAPSNKQAQLAISIVLETEKAEDGGIALGPSTSQRSDVCVNGMFLNYASYFQSKEGFLQSVVDALLAERTPDGGFNCRSTRSGARHSSLHSTISVLEGLREFLSADFQYRKTEIEQTISAAEEFILIHQLFLSDRTGEAIKPEFLKFSYPCRWKYDILRALDYFQQSGRKWDGRLKPAIEVLLSKRNKGGSWNMQAAHPGQVHVQMERAGKPGRWNTLRALRVLKKYQL